MVSQTHSFKEHLTRRQTIIDQEKSAAQNAELFNEKTFYRSFIKDLFEAKREVIIYSPFITKHRTDFYKNIIEKLRKRNIEVFIFTRPIEEYSSILQPQIECALKRYEEMGVCVFYLGKYIHEKAAIIDREILWEGSLNILAHRAGNEMMRRIRDEDSAMQVISHIGLNKKLEEGYKQRYEKLCRNLIDNSRRNIKQKICLFALGLSIPLLIWWLIFFSKTVIGWIN